MGQQYLRQVNLIVGNSDTTIDLSQMHIQFQVFAPDTNQPPSAVIKVYNLKDDTANKIQKEFDKISLQAGYDEPGVIFSGKITQVTKGAEDAKDRFVLISAADLDDFYNWGIVNKTLAKGASPQDQVNAIVSSAAGSTGAKVGTIPNSLGTGGTLPRGKVLFGMAREHMSVVAKSNNMSWYIADGKINYVQNTGYLPGEAVVLNSSSGLLGVPEATNNGVECKCLINPKIKVGGRVQIDSSDLTTTSITTRTAQNAGSFPANTSANGMYRVLVIEHAGDNRGNQFETSLTCLAVDSSSPADSSVSK